MVYSKTLVEVIENKVIPEFTIYNLEVPLSPKAGGRYKIFDSQFNEGNIILNRILNSNELYKYKYSNVFDLARNNVNSEDKALAQACKKYWGGMQMRKNVVYSNPAKLIATRQIIDYIGPERK